MVHEVSHEVCSHDAQWCRAALSAVDDAVVVAGADARVTFLNEVAETLLGWRPDEAIGEPLDRVLRLVDETSGEAVAPTADRVLAPASSPPSSRGDLAFIARDGVRRPFHGSVRRVDGEPGHVEAVVAVFHDATRRRAAESDLRVAEEGFRVLVESTLDYAIFMLDEHGRVRTWNRGAQRIKGYAPDEIIGRHFSIFYPAEAVASGWPDTELRHAAAEGRFEDEGWRVRKDGSRFWANVVISALRDETGQLRGFSKITRDLTERRAAEDAIRQREERFRAVAETATDAIVVADASGTVTFRNPAASRMFALPEETRAVPPLHSLLAAPHRAALDAAISGLKARRAAAAPTLVLEGRRTDGTEFPIELSLSTWTTRGEERFYCATVRDVTERQQLERARVHAEVMEDLDRRKDEFLAMLSHELRNPLAPIMSALHLMRTQSQEPVQRQARAVVERQVGQLTRLVDDLLEVSRVLSSGIRLRQEFCDFRIIVDRALETARPLIVEQRHRISVDLPARPLRLLGDPTRLEQVIVNLLTNAAKYTPAGGRISVELRTEGSEAVLSVKDEGIGIPAELLPKVFELFTQGQRTLDRSQGGLGIGLTVVKRVVELHGGAVEARSRGPGLGSEFVVRLPLSSGSLPDPRDAAPANASAPSAPTRVLVVDDNKDSAEMTALLLKAIGHTVMTAFDGLAALDAAAAFRPEVILLDIGLPGIDGYEVARRIRANSELAPVRLIALSGYGQEKDRARSQEAGFDAHLVKPVDPARVLELVNEP